jgi:hypothetical protein
LFCEKQVETDRPDLLSGLIEFEIEVEAGMMPKLEAAQRTVAPPAHNHIRGREADYLKVTR